MNNPEHAEAVKAFLIGKARFKRTQPHELKRDEGWKKRYQFFYTAR